MNCTIEKIELQYNIICEDVPKIYVACLSAYNNGKLHGKFIDASQGVDHIYEEIKNIMESSPEDDAEEWAIHDYENFGHYKVSEYHDLETLAEVSEFLTNCENKDVASWLIQDYDLEGAKDMLENNFLGVFDSDEDYAYEYVNDCGLLESLPKSLRNYFDYESFGRDMELNGDIFSIDNHYFNSH